MPTSAETVSTFNPRVAPEDVGRLLLQATLEPGNATENLFARIEQGEDLVLPTNYVGSEHLIVPSLEVVSPRGREARLVDIHASDTRLDRLYKSAVGGRKGMADTVQRMAYEATVRMLDTSGAEGLHHVHGTSFPRTVFYDTKRTNGAMPNVYLTTLGDMSGTRQPQVPVIAMITATAGAKDQLKLMKIMGADLNRKRFNT